VDLVIVVSDGLSATAASRQVVAVMRELLPLLEKDGWVLGPVGVVEGGRVAIQDEIGELLGARLSLILLGERPGLGSPDSLGAYFTWGPRAGRSDAERNCVSNIRPEGLAPAAAARRLHALLSSSRRLGLSGIGLKDDTFPALIPADDHRVE
jgi:ethanolamine ammonia-lyase small subunit